MQEKRFKVHSEFAPAGDQPAAIAKLVEGLGDGLRYQTLLGATGTGKTYTMAKIIEATQRPALVMAPNKILTAQLAAEFRDFFPDNAVEFFISYYDYYQPEAYVPGKDLFIEKDASVNAEIERLRHSATKSLMTRRDVIVVASVSAIYGLGDPAEYTALNMHVRQGEEMGREEIIERLIAMQYERNDVEMSPGRFRVKGDTLDIWAAYDERPIRIELWGDEVDGVWMLDPITGERGRVLGDVLIYPAKHYVASRDRVDRAVSTISAELEERLRFFAEAEKPLEAQRIKERTLYDLEMLKILGHCSGIENYSRHVDGRAPGQTPYTMLDYFPDDFITFLDESHITVSQIGGMSNGDRARKQTLVDHGFRLPSALDNRPLNLDEFLEKTGQTVFVSATPAAFEREHSDAIVDQLIRPTGLLDPVVSLHPVEGQIEHLHRKILEKIALGERTLVTTLTKRMSEDLTEYFIEKGVRVRYMHSDIDSVERQVIVRDLRLGHFDVLIGINLLREGLDLPEVSLVAILDADKPGFLRSERSLIQTIGRAARHENGEVILYGDSVTPAMDYAIKETARRREKQMAHNEAHGIVPRTVKKAVRDVIRGDSPTEDGLPEDMSDREAVKEHLLQLESEMWQASEALDFERASALRDEIRKVEGLLQGKVSQGGAVLKSGKKARGKAPKGRR